MCEVCTYMNAKKPKEKTEMVLKLWFYRPEKSKPKTHHRTKRKTKKLIKNER